MSLSDAPLPLPLPEGWSQPEVFADRLTVAGISVDRAGVASTGPSGLEVTGSAACRNGAARARADLELRERIATVEALARPDETWPTFGQAGEQLEPISGREAFPRNAPDDTWRFARSSGVALHDSWSRACAAALAELAERDRVLVSWYGDIEPVDVDVPAALRDTTGYAWRAVALPAPPGWWSESLHVVCVAGLPGERGNPLALGYGAASSEEEAKEKAAGEALQGLAFLWGETIPEAPPDLAPSALGHLEHWLHPGHHDALRTWLDGGHRQHRRGAARDEDHAVRYLDLTPSWLPCGMRVAKAFCRAAEPLAFGRSPFGNHLPDTMRVHPIV